MFLYDLEMCDGSMW